MAISKFAIPRSSSGSILSGSFSALDHLQQFVDSINSSIEESLDDTVRYAQDDLRKSALSHPAWSQYADNLTVHHRDGALVYGTSGTPEQVQAMNELEYGNQSSDPQPLLRIKAYRHDPERVERLKVGI